MKKTSDFMLLIKIDDGNFTLRFSALHCYSPEYTDDHRYEFVEVCKSIKGLKTILTVF